MTLELVPISLADAKRFVAAHHRHNVPPRGWKWGVGVTQDGQIVGVAVASRPVARMLDDGRTLEVTRTCTDGTRNANSKLYGAVARAAKALGYDRLVTYTLAEEPGSSLRAVGWLPDDELPARPGWDMPSRPRTTTDVTLFGEEPRTPTGPKVRWVKVLRDRDPAEMLDAG